MPLPGARATRPLTRLLGRVEDAPPVFLVGVPVRHEAGKPKAKPSRTRSARALAVSYMETATGAALAGLAGLILISLLPVPAPAPEPFGAPSVARALLWLAGAGALGAAAIAGILAAATRPAGGRAMALGMLAAIWGGWVGGLAAAGLGLLGLRCWEALGGRVGPVIPLPPAALAMGPLAWIAVGTLWALLVGWFLPFAPGHPGGRPARSCLLAGLAGLVGSVTAAQTGVMAPMLLLVAAAIGVAGQSVRP